MALAPMLVVVLGIILHATAYSFSGSSYGSSASKTRPPQYTCECVCDIPVNITQCSIFNFACLPFGEKIFSGLGVCVPGSTTPLCTASIGYNSDRCQPGAFYDACHGICALAGCNKFFLLCSKSTCFPGNALVELRNGSSVPMSELKIGDHVRVDTNKYSEVYMFSHRMGDARSLFSHIKTAASTITMSPDHYLYVNGRLATASTVVAGDHVQGADGAMLLVEAVTMVAEDGLYNPHTLDGNIIVNGIKTSTYTAAIAPTLAHAALWPIRMLYSLGYDIINGAFDEGSELIANIMPKGHNKY